MIQVITNQPAVKDRQQEASAILYWGLVYGSLGAIHVLYNSFYLTNKDISLNVSLIRLKCSTQGDKGQMEGSVSQTFYLCPSFYSIQNQKINFEKNTKSFPLFVIK